MKGWLYESKNILYVFPQTPDVIPNDMGADAIAVQEEDIKAWATVNPDLADVLVKYNYNVMTVKPKVWADHQNDDIPGKHESVVLSVQHDMLGIGYIKVNGVEQELDKAQQILITVMPEDEIKFTLESGYSLQDVRSNDGEVETTQEGSEYVFTMPQVDAWITLRAPEHRIIGDTWAVVDILQNGEPYDIDHTTTGATISVIPKEYKVLVRVEGQTTHTQYPFTDESGYYNFTMPNEDVYISLQDTRQDPELSWSSSSATVDIDDHSPVYPTLTNPNNLTVEYLSTEQSVATIDSSTGIITLVGVGTTEIIAIFAGDSTYYEGRANYNLTVQSDEPA